MNPATPASAVRIPTTHSPFTPAGPAANSYNVAIQLLPGSPLATAFHTCQVDTGSCGIVIPESLLYENSDPTGNLLPGVTKGAPVTIPYEPSDISLHGFSYTLPALGLGANPDGSCAHICEDVTVVGVTDGHPGMGMMGVGFGRPQQWGTNVLIRNGLYPSYLLTTEGIWIGYSPDTLPNAGQFGFQKLQPASDPLDWQSPSVTITLTTDGVSTPYPGTALLDTGITSMMLAASPAGWPAALNGSTVTIAWNGTGAEPVLSYRFGVVETQVIDIDGHPKTVHTVSGTPGMLPIYLIALDSREPSFVNTGINVIRGASFYYDAQVGQVGFLRLS